MTRMTFAQVQVLPAAPGWADYLPSVLQLPVLYFTMAVAIATVCACKALPLAYRQPWIIQLVTLTVSCLMMLGQLGARSIVYAIGTGIVCSSLSTTFYDLIFSVIEARVRAFLGTPNGGTIDPSKLPPDPTGPNLKSTALPEGKP